VSESDSESTLDSPSTEINCEIIGKSGNGKEGNTKKENRVNEIIEGNKLDIVPEENDGSKIITKMQDPTCVSDSNVFVNNVPDSMTKQALVEMLGEYGDIVSVSQERSKPGKASGSAFIRFVF
jgi:RNA recognition motif-containing protein